MRLAIMQPYFFPYLGYFQLLQASDHFLFLTDVQYQHLGWINRNRIIQEGKPSWITIPIQDFQKKDLIENVNLVPTPFWKERIANQIKNAYQKAPFFFSVWPLIEDALHFSTPKLSCYAINSIQTIAQYLEIPTKTAIAPKTAETGENKIINLCKQTGADCYLNLSGGEKLYHPKKFAENTIDLLFHKFLPCPYPQKSLVFIPSLSIIDVIMNLSQKQSKEILSYYLFTTSCQAQKMLLSSEWATTQNRPCITSEKTHPTPSLALASQKI